MPQRKTSRRKPIKTPESDAVLLTLDQACARTQLSRPSVVGLIKDGRLRGIKVGTTWRISAASIELLASSDDGEL
jgi:excisionase family DNA binding protein